MAFPSPASSSSSSSLVHQSDDSSARTLETQVANKLLSNALLLSPPRSPSSSSFRHFTPLLLLHQQPSPKLNVHLHAQVAVAERLFRDFHQSVVSAAEFVRSFASKSPLFDKLLSLPSHFRNFSQIHQKNYRNMNCLSKHNFGAIFHRTNTIAGGGLNECTQGRSQDFGLPWAAVSNQFVVSCGSSLSAWVPYMLTTT